jgi:alcohol dehydrogenase class IV
MGFEFNFAVPTRLAFGATSLDQLAPVVAEASSQVLVLAGQRSARASGLLHRCIGALNEAGVRTHVHEGIMSNPTYESIVSAHAIAAEAGVDAIVAIGGGSVMDAGRAVALMLAKPDEFWECRVTGKLSVPGIPADIIPVFTLPTVHGTGAEMSPAMLLRRGVAKEVFFSPYLFPHAAFIDPALSRSVPARTTAEVGVDAMIQGLEAYVSRNAQPFSDAFALEAVRLAKHWLPVAVCEPGHVTARAHVALAALMSLFAINQAGVGGIHALSNPLSGRYDIHHGRALSLVAVAVVEHNCDAAPERFAVISHLLSGKDAPVTSALGDWLAPLGLGGRLADYGVRADHLDEMAAEAQNPDMSTNPMDMPARAVRDIYASLL